MKILILLLFIFSCQKHTQPLDSNNSNFWTIKYFVDKNYEPTNVGYITNTNPITGSYSNSRIENNALEVKMMIKERAVGIKLYENTNKEIVKANNQYPIEYTMQMKHNNKKIDFVFKGINENNVVVIGDIISSTHQKTLINYLKKGGKFNFLLESKNDPKNSTYNFEINVQSKSIFSDLLNQLNLTKSN